MTDKTKNLSEAAAEVLKANKATKQPGEKFGQGEKLDGSTVHDAGNPALGKLAIDGVPSATAPGSTNHLGQQPAETLSNQPAQATPKDSAVVKKTSVKATNLEATEEEDEEVVNEDIEALMAGENLSEEFKKKATAIFEAAVTAKVTELSEELEAQYLTQFEEAYEEMKEDFATKVDEYLDYVVESWLEENKLAVESGIKTEITEGFISSLKQVFEEHYIDIPDEKFNVVEELASKVEALEKQVNEEMYKNIDLKQKLSEQKKVEALHSVCEGLTISQTEKLKSIAESVEFVSSDDFESQMETIKESYFSTVSVKPASKESLNEFIEINEETKPTVTIDPMIAAYAAKISSTLR